MKNIQIYSLKMWHSLSHTMQNHYLKFLIFPVLFIAITLCSEMLFPGELIKFINNILHAFGWSTPDIIEPVRDSKPDIPEPVIDSKPVVSEPVIDSKPVVSEPVMDSTSIPTDIPPQSTGIDLHGKPGANLDKKIVASAALTGILTAIVHDINSPNGGPLSIDELYLVLVLEGLIYTPAFIGYLIDLCTNADVDIVELLKKIATKLYNLRK